MAELMDASLNDSQKDMFMTFTVGKETYGIEISHIIEIIGMQEYTEVPEMPDYIKGIINLRGNIIPLMDVRLRFRMEPRPYDDRTCVIVTVVDTVLVGLIVDRVVEVQTIDDEQIAPPPGMFTEVSHAYLSGIGKMEDRVALLLNCEKLFSENELEEARVSLYAGLKNFETTEEIKN